MESERIRALYRREVSLAFFGTRHPAAVTCRHRKNLTSVSVVQMRFAPLWIGGGT